MLSKTLKTLTKSLRGFINTAGQRVIAPQFQCEYAESKILCGPFINSLARVIRKKPIGQQDGLLNSTGAYVIPPQFLYASHFSDGLAMVRVGKDFGIACAGYINTRDGDSAPVSSSG
ncbi:MAG: WG repeat-containing protein [Gloeomargarita sp. SKYG98]|nr:WG repeat-containing protein [Gloeomargarita sp. SKYG98]